MRRWVPAPSSVAGREPRSTGKVPGRRRRAPQWAGRAPEKKRKEPHREGRVLRRTGKAPPRTGRTPPRTGRAPWRLYGPCPGTGASRLRRIPPPNPGRLRRAGKRALQRCGCGAPGRPGQPRRAGRAPHTPPDPGDSALREDRDIRSPQGCGWPCSAPPRPSRRPVALPLTGTGRAAGHYSITGAAGPGEAREPSAAQEGAGDHVPRGRRPATRAARSIPLGGGGGRGLQEIQTLRQEIGILTKHSGPAAAPRRGLPPRLTLGRPAHCRAPE